jgi:hypothetical protein
MSKPRRPIPHQPQKPKAAFKPETVVVAFIHPGQTSAYFTTSILGTMLYDFATERRIVGVINEWSSANVSAARNSLTGKFVDDYTADWLLWIDADMGWDHDALDKLLASADPVKAPIVSGLCFGATLSKLFPTIYQLADHDGALTTVRVTEFEDDSLVQCSATGAAFLLIHRSVLVAIRERTFNRTFPWFQESELNGAPAGEDITFCLRAGLCGFPVHVNTGVSIGHHKSRLLTLEAFREQEASDRNCDSPASA